MRELVPFIIAEIGIILLIIVFPSLSTWLPDVLR